MLRRPRFKPHLHAEALEGEGILLLSEVGQTVLRGRLHEQVAPLIDGRRSTDDIADQLRGQVDPARVYYTLSELERKGFLCESEPALPECEAALWSLLGVDALTATRRLAKASVSVSAIGEVEPGPLHEALQSLRVRVADDGGLALVLADDYLNSDLKEFNRRALDEDRPWLLVKPVGCQIWVGPLFRPGKTGCWECLAQRLRSNRSAEMIIHERPERAKTLSFNCASSAATRQIAYNMAANEVAKWIVGSNAFELEGKVLTIDVRSWKQRVHTLIRLPQCPACGQAPDKLDRPANPIELQSRTKLVTFDGGRRIHSPEETLKLYEHHVSPVIGAVSMLEPYPLPGDGVMHVYSAGQNHARGARSLDDVRRHLRNSSSGKGVTDAQAKASGLCEALERYSGVFRGDEPRRTARLADLGAAAIHPNDLMLYSARQFAERDQWNARKSLWNHVTIEFDVDAEVEWTPIWSLTRQATRYFPTSGCYYDYLRPMGEPYCVACSNGNAAGNTIEEAILQGFFEVVERDAVALWWYNRVQRPGVDPHSFGEPYLQQLADFLAQRQRDMWILDLTSDLEIPTFAALSRSTTGPREGIMFGFGSHLDPRVALLRAATELSQMLVWVLCGDDKGTGLAIDDPETAEWIETATIAEHPYLLPDAKAPLRKASDFPRRYTDDLREDVLFCQRLVEAHGLEFMVLDQTRPDIGLPVVKVIVPGMRHFWARYAPGRLYDVPVRLGWLPEPLKEEQLNPIPLFL